MTTAPETATAGAGVPGPPRATRREALRRSQAAEDRLARRGLFTLGCFASALLVSIVIPYVFSREYFRDGAYIVGIPGSAGSESDSYEVTAFLLSPMFRLLRAAGIDLDRYGVVLDLDMVVANSAFGVIGFVFVAGVLLAYRLPRRYGWEAARILAVVVLLGPFVFLISKEIIALVVCGVVLLAARWLRWPVWTTCLVWAGTLVALSSLFRAYYLATGVLIVAGYFLARGPRRALLFYLAFCASLFVAYPFLPIDDITAGRAEFLADVSGSRIEYPVDDSSAAGFAISRTYAFAILLAPIDLAIRSVVYLPYVALQLLITVRVVQVVRRHRSGLQLLAAHVVLAFTAVGALYEPDFGSYFRHKVGTLLFLVVLMAGRWRPAGRSGDGRELDDEPPLGEVSRAVGAGRRPRAPRADDQACTPRRSTPTLPRSPHWRPR